MVGRRRPPFGTARCGVSVGPPFRSEAAVTNIRDLGVDRRGQEDVLDAAVAELLATGIASFSLEGVATRAGVPVDSIRRIWPNSPGLLTDALVHFGANHLPVPDTGTFRGDLLEYTRTYAGVLNSPLGRRLVDAVIIRPRDWDLSTARPAMLEKRYLNVAVIVERGVQRGECAPDVDAVRLIDMIGMGLCLPILFYDRPIDDEDCEFVIDTVLNGIRPRR